MKKIEEGGDDFQVEGSGEGREKKPDAIVSKPR